MIKSVSFLMSPTMKQLLLLWFTGYALALPGGLAPSNPSSDDKFPDVGKDINSSLRPTLDASTIDIIAQLLSPFFGLTAKLHRHDQSVADLQCLKASQYTVDEDEPVSVYACGKTKEQFLSNETLAVIIVPDEYFVEDVKDKIAVQEESEQLSSSGVTSPTAIRESEEKIEVDKDVTLQKQKATRTLRSDLEPNKAHMKCANLTNIYEDKNGKTITIYLCSMERMKESGTKTDDLALLLVASNFLTNQTSTDTEDPSASSPAEGLSALQQTNFFSSLVNKTASLSSVIKEKLSAPMKPTGETSEEPSTMPSTISPEEQEDASDDNVEEITDNEVARSAEREGRWFFSWDWFGRLFGKRPLQRLPTERPNTVVFSSSDAVHSGPPNKPLYVEMQQV